jgi:ADP-dependent NAD(P)H-hydrate dehydratase / NAD(P)H-hydrate epimerase
MATPPPFKRTKTGDAVALLTVSEMYTADSLAIGQGTPGIDLMENAGRAVFDAICARWEQRPTVVICGPGNNGGDGFVIARLLNEAGWPVRLGLLGERDKLKGDCALAAARWTGAVEVADPTLLDGDPLVIDALLGAGLLRPVEGPAADLVDAMAGKTVVAVDLPSGVHGDDGQVLGVAPQAALTVTFFRKKPGHALAPGRFLCGEIVVADIGIAADALDIIQPNHWENAPDLWSGLFPRPKPGGHKYLRGHAVVLGGARMTGAARLAARGALRAGAGLVTVVCPAAAAGIYAAGSPSLIIEPADDEAAFAALLSDPRKNAVLLGPGAGVGPVTRARVLAALEAEKACVLDADALTSFADEPQDLLDRLDDRCLLTPHEGEFSRLFDDSHFEGRSRSKLTRARIAAAHSGAVVLLKGADTVIAAPDGRAAINTVATPYLATAGSGDVLGGIALGLMAQGMPTFEAACAAARLHGSVGVALGPGLIAEDIADALPGVLRELLG